MFPDTYKQARAGFLKLAGTAATHLESHVLSEGGGVQGEVLAMDVATFGNADASKALLIICGTHGLEGPPGSAVQRAFLEQIKALPADTKIVAVHALNPWGFSHGSRTDDANVDVNRNFVDFGAPLPNSPAYAELHASQCPAKWSDDAKVHLSKAVARCLQNKGLGYVLEGLTTGQHQEPTGLNYAGTSPSWSNRIFEVVAHEHFRSCAKIAYVEWHSGVGKYGELFHVCTHAPGSEELDRVADWWGRDAVTRNGDAFEGTAGSAPNWRGLLLNAFPGMVPHAQVAGAVIEFGTYGNQDVLEGLMIDRWLRFGTANLSSLGDEALEEKMKEAFAPRDPYWRALVIEKGIEAQRKALDGLGRW